ncbi:Pr6Pr family membrane protein [Amycolatopsis sp. PS_44_ISF1]|uniref:Pr6Pr family membrane protein n=1 Tax=Amycolatopsis sp. PS_44_ISF1 TaxID=2974917 RepID=UPI0028DEE61A|nr:Pr6Pr family membrane protein [Amycolatopsis sp. PS_44_ISF1]MDT8915275.1 Pr6Pr family membrane protein [Amycolatopsis sp. PS_44_ISF1]
MTTRPAVLTVSRWCYGLIAAVIAVALVIQIVLVFQGGADANSGETGQSAGVRLWRLFSYFTIQSNLILLAVAVVQASRPASGGRIWRVARLDALLGILITGLVYAIVLAPQIHLTGWPLAATIGFHYVSPWAAVAAWLVFGPRPGTGGWGTVAAAFGWPVVWLVYIFVQGAFTHWYPYPFMDVTEIGFATAVRNALLVVVVALVFAGLVRLADRKLPALRREPG